jgi:hypothetical protein
MNTMLLQKFNQLLSIVGFYLKNPAALERDCPAATIWKSHVDASLTPTTSRPLSDSESAMASLLGVKHPERVIICDYTSIQKMMERSDNQVIQMLNLCTELPAEGITLGYTIGIRNYQNPKHNYLAHELVHLTQYEKMNDFSAYMKAYLRLFPGNDVLSYVNHPMELEANRVMLTVA